MIFEARNLGIGTAVVLLPKTLNSGCSVKVHRCEGFRVSTYVFDFSGA